MRRWIVGRETTHLSLFLHFCGYDKITRDWDGCTQDRTPMLFRSYKKAKQVADEFGWEVHQIGPRLLARCSDHQRGIITAALKKEGSK